MDNLLVVSKCFENPNPSYSIAGNCPRFEVLITELAIGWNLVGAGVIVL